MDNVKGDIELDAKESESTSSASSVQRKDIPLKLTPKSQGRGRGKGRGRSATKTIARGRATRSSKRRAAMALDLETVEDAVPEPLPEDEDGTTTMEIEKKEETTEEVQDENLIDTSFAKNEGQPLKWNQKLNLIGEKITDPVIHLCELCSHPILLYGRLISCKHVFCFTCATKNDKICKRCGDPVERIEQSRLGNIFLCTYGGTKHGLEGCRRTYLSQRDLQAHINHRHARVTENPPPPPPTQYTGGTGNLAAAQQPQSMYDYHQEVSSIPVLTGARSNLITVPIQDGGDYRRHGTGVVGGQAMGGYPAPGGYQPYPVHGPGGSGWPLPPQQPLPPRDPSQQRAQYYQ